MGDVLLHIAGSQSVDGNTSEMDFVTRGEIAKNGEQYIIKYCDGADDTVIDVDGKTVTIRRPDTLLDRLVLENRKQYCTQCITPFGNFGVSIYPTLVDTQLGEDKGRIELEYIMDVAGNQGVNRLNLSYEER